MPDKLNQVEVDAIRYDVAMQLVVTAVNDRDPHVGVRHIRFPQNRMGHYLLRQGNPPADSDRNPWERGLRLEVDVGDVPPSLALLVMQEKHKARMDEGSKLPHSSRYAIRKEAASLIEKVHIPKLIEPAVTPMRRRSVDDIPDKIRKKQVSLGFGGTGKK